MPIYTLPRLQALSGFGHLLFTIPLGWSNHPSSDASSGHLRSTSTLVLLCIRVIQRPSGMDVSGGSSRHSGPAERAVAQSSYQTPSWPTSRKAMAWADRWRQGICTVTRSPAAQSRKAGLEDASNPFNMESSRSPWRPSLAVPPSRPISFSTLGAGLV